MSKKQGSMMQKIQRFGGAMFTPVLLFAVFGILVGFSALFQNPIVMGDLAETGTGWYKFWNTVNTASNTVFKQMPLIFAIGLPIALAKKQSGRACLESLVIYLTFHYFINALLTHWAPTFGVDFESTARTSGLTSVAGILTLDMGMVGAIMISGIAVWLHNKFFDKELPKSIENFSGTPLVTLIGFVMMFPAALLACIIMFAPLGIGAAFYTTAQTKRRKRVISILVPVVITATLAGITEPIEFTFLFVAPLLFIVHCFLAACMSAVTYMFGITGDFSLGLIQNASLNWLPLFKTHGGQYVIQILIGIVFAFLYFVIFRYLILKFDFKTPGREEGEDDVKFFSKADYKNKQNEKGGTSKYIEQAEHFLEGLGGKDNIVDVSNCATRLRVSIKDTSLLKDTAFFKQKGAHGLVVNKNAIQIIVGLKVPTVREEFEKLL